MKKALLGLTPDCHWTAYTYDVDYTFAVTTTLHPGSITGLITTNCQDAIKTRAIFCRGHSRQATAMSGSSSNPGSGN